MLERSEIELTDTDNEEIRTAFDIFEAVFKKLNIDNLHSAEHSLRIERNVDNEHPPGCVVGNRNELN